MTAKIIEIATITLAPGKTETDLVQASNAFQTFLSTQPGFIARRLVRKADGHFADVIEWKDKVSAEAIMQVAGNSPECGAYFSIMKMDGMDPTEGVAHYSVLAEYQ